jgi:ABC-type nitrate/sulfonate/bicarbonate transport system substrate-binding protein
MRGWFAVVSVFWLLGSAPLHSAAADTVKLTVIAFAGPPNLPMYVAQAKEFYARRGLTVEIKLAANSTELRNGLADGTFQIAQSAIDNAFALKDKANVDIAVVLGGDNSFNHLIVRPEIHSIADIKGRTVVVDAPNTAFAFQLYEMLRQKGLNKADYAVKPAGSSGARLAEMSKDKDMVAAMMSPPFSILAQNAGMKNLGSAADALGAYQGSSLFVLRSWGAANRDTLVKFLHATIEGTRWALEPANKVEAIALLARRLNLAEDVAAQSYEQTKGDFSRDGALDMVGVQEVLRLRAQYEGGTPAAPDGYVDLSYYKTALSGL